MTILKHSRVRFGAAALIIVVAVAACAPEPQVEIPTLMVLATVTAIVPTQTSDDIAVINATDTIIPTVTAIPATLDSEAIVINDSPTPTAMNTFTTEPKVTQGVENTLVMRGAPTFAVFQNVRVASAGAIYYVVSREPIPVYACPSDACELVWLLAPGGQVNVVQTVGLWHYIVIANEVNGYILASSVTTIAPTRLPTRTPTLGIVPLNLFIATPIPYIVPAYYGGTNPENVNEESATALPRTPWRRPPTQTVTPSRTPTITRTPTQVRPGSVGAPATSTRATPTSGAPIGSSPPPGAFFTRTPSGPPVGGSPPPTSVVSLTPSWTPTFTPTVTQTVIESTATETPTPSATPTLTLTSTPTLLPPTATYSPTWTPTPTLTWTPEPTQTPPTSGG